MTAQSRMNTAADIAATMVPQGTVALWWLGQASFALRTGLTTILIDPFLTPTQARLIPPPFTAEESPAVDLVLCTHEHSDHLDPAAFKIIAQRSPQARFIAPRPIVDLITAHGIAPERVQGVQPDEEIQLGEVRLHPVPAVHGLHSPPAVYDFGFEISNGLYRYLGYVLDLDGVRVYHPGDTLVFDGLIERVRALSVDIALFPINGRSYFREQRGLVGNMDEREAADLAAAIGATVLVPTHYDMFAANLGRPGVLVDYVRANHPELSCYLPSHGRRFTYMKGNGNSV